MKLWEDQKDLGWVIALSKSATETSHAHGLRVYRKIEETFEDNIWVKYHYGIFVLENDSLQQEWSFNDLNLEWVDFIQPYKPTFKDKFYKWLFRKDYPQTVKVRPADGTLVITSYDRGEHYEIVEYNNRRWITELSFPCEPDKWAYVPNECVKAAQEYISCPVKDCK